MWLTQNSLTLTDAFAMIGDDGVMLTCTGCWDLRKCPLPGLSGWSDYRGYSVMNNTMLIPGPKNCPL